MIGGNVAPHADCFAGQFQNALLDRSKTWTMFARRQAGARTMPCCQACGAIKNNKGGNAEETTAF
jgi:hypothetical protein